MTFKHDPDGSHDDTDWEPTGIFGWLLFMDYHIEPNDDDVYELPSFDEMEQRQRVNHRTQPLYVSDLFPDA
jgi:hypothetical protein